MSGQVQVELRTGEMVHGYTNGKVYGNAIYVTPEGYKSGIKILVANIISQRAVEADPVRKTAKRASNGPCPICHTYCYGDCQANS